VGLVDEPLGKSEENAISNLENYLNNGGKRLFRLGKNDQGEKLDLEKAIPELIYNKANYVKTEVIAKINYLKTDYKKLGTYKEEIAVALSQALEVEDLELDEMKIF
jgi:hypothetical protein